MNTNIMNVRINEMTINKCMNESALSRMKAVANE